MVPVTILLNGLGHSVYRPHITPERPVNSVTYAKEINKRMVFMNTIQADVLVIGGGSAGMGAFRAARKATDNVYIVEDY